MFKYGDHRLEKSAGVILIEVMLLLTLGVLLISSLLGIFIHSQASSRWQDALIGIPMKAKAVNDLLTSDIQMSGYIGCPKLTTDFPMISYFSYQLTPQTKLIGSDKDIRVVHASFPAALVVEAMHDLSNVVVSRNIHFKVGDIAIISDCTHGEIFKIKSVDEFGSLQRILSTQPLHHKYESNAEISRLEVNRYYIGKTDRVNRVGAPVYSLYVENISHRHLELVEGIDHMEIRYTCLQGSQLMDCPAEEVGDWSQVVGIAIDITVDDYPLRKEWHTYIAL